MGPKIIGECGYQEEAMGDSLEDLGTVEGCKLKNEVEDPKTRVWGT